MTNQIKQNLIALRELLTPAQQWTQDSYSRDAGGHKIDATHPKAVCWCLLGGIQKVIGAPEGATPPQLIEMVHVFENVIAGKGRGGVTLVNFNDKDKTTHAMVLEKIDQAIDLQG